MAESRSEVQSLSEQVVDAIQRRVVQIKEQQDGLVRERALLEQARLELSLSATPRSILWRLREAGVEVDLGQ